jgi:hypothetical protein
MVHGNIYFNYILSHLNNRDQNINRMQDYSIEIFINKNYNFN